MLLLLARHARPVFDPDRIESPGPTPVSESDLLQESQLSPRGEAQAAHLGRVLLEEFAERGLDLVLRAPTSVCAATAQIIERAWCRGDADSNTACRASFRVRTSHALAPGASVRDAIDLIHEHANARALLFLGHNPQLGELLSTLAGGAGARNLILRSGELIALEVRAAQPIGTARVVQRWMPVATGSLCADLTAPSARSTPSPALQRAAA